MTPKILTTLDRLQRAKFAAGEIARMADKQRDHLSTLIEDLRRLQVAAPKVNKIAYLTDRIDRMRELLNMMESGSFSIQIDREMQAVWEEMSQ